MPVRQGSRDGGGGDEVKAEMKGFRLTGETPLPKTKRKEGRKDRVFTELQGAESCGSSPVK